MTVQRYVSAPPGLVWVKSSYSTGNGGECVEIAWRKSSYSGAEGGECLEVASMPTQVLVRDSKQVEGPIVLLSPEAWAAFVRRPAV
ncbi:DUF397 domain-containing protein [Streptomyces microflavus]|uniref:DUF397 domain-containing protein n=1 Tax=Streptomyces microflavus TaxID=1919 RepID=UPI0033BCE2C2